MSNNKCTLSEKELIEKCNEWVHSLAKSGGKTWTLQVSVNFNRDPDMLFIELGKRYEALQAENSKMRKALEKSLEWIADTNVKEVNLDDKKGMALYHIKWLATEAVKTTDHG